MSKCNNCKNLGIKNNSFDTYSWCEKTNGCPHEYIERDCEHYAPMTNADRIRSMTDEKLAEFLCRVKSDYHEFPSEEEHGEWKEWLQSKAE